jgi:hypothetical protein
VPAAERLEEVRVLLGGLPPDARSSFLYEVNKSEEKRVVLAWYYETDRAPDDVARDVGRRLSGFGCRPASGARYRCGEYECYLTLVPPSPSSAKTVYAVTAAWPAGG